MSNYRTCLRCHKKTKSYTHYCNECYPDIVEGALPRRKRRPPAPERMPKSRPFDATDCFLICIDDYIGVTARQMSVLYDREEKEIVDQLDACKKDGRYEFFLSRWQLKDVYDLYMEKWKKTSGKEIFRRK